MGLNFKQAFSYEWNDSDFFTKWLIGSFILVFPALPEWMTGIKKFLIAPGNMYWLLLFITISIIAYLAIIGYFYKAVHNRIVHSEEQLPQWQKFWLYVRRGARACLGAGLMTLPYFVLFGGTVYLYQLDYTSPIFIAIAVILGMAFLALYLVFSLNFAVKMKLSAFLNYERAFRRLEGRWREFFVFYLVCITLAVVSTIVCALLSLHNLTTLIVPFFMFYICLVLADLYSQFLFD